MRVQRGIYCGFLFGLSSAAVVVVLRYANFGIDGRVVVKGHRSVHIINESALSKCFPSHVPNSPVYDITSTLNPICESSHLPYHPSSTPVQTSPTKISLTVESGKKNLNFTASSRPNVPVSDNVSSLHSSSLSSSQLNFSCLKHTTIKVNASQVMGRAFALLDMTMREGCGPLRRDWRNNQPLSPLAKRILQQQSNCSLPVVTWNMSTGFGLGSQVAQWSQAMCYSWEHQMRLQSYNPMWLWMDQTHCNRTDAAQRSPWLCYLPDMEVLCEQTVTINRTMVDPRFQPNECWHKKQPGFVPAFRAASVEYMFRTVSPLVLQEARRQVGVLFGAQGAPKDLITVHVRWGDKSYEMKLLGIQEYINATSHILHHELGQRHTNDTANIYLATEDPAAAHAFARAAPKSWNIYRDVAIDELSRFRPSTRYNSASIMSSNTLGRGGLLNMASMLVALEANYFVLTTASSFSRIINSIRTNILDPRCHNCTRMIDLQSGMWR
jgi:hypothetical protein